MVPLDLPYKVCYWRLISNILPNSGPLRDIRFLNPSDLDFELSKSLKVKSDGVIALAVHGFLLMANSNIRANSVPLRDIKALKSQWPWLDLDLSRSLKIKRDGVIGLIIYGSLLMINSNIGTNLTPLQEMTLLYLSDPNFDLSMSLKVKSNSAFNSP